MCGNYWLMNRIKISWINTSYIWYPSALIHLLEKQLPVTTSFSLSFVFCRLMLRINFGDSNLFPIVPGNRRIPSSHFQNFSMSLNPLPLLRHLFQTSLLCKPCLDVAKVNCLVHSRRHLLKFLLFERKIIAGTWANTRMGRQTTLSAHERCIEI